MYSMEGGKKACSYSYFCFVSEHFCSGVVCNHTAHQDQPLARPCLEDQRWNNGHLNTGNHPSAVLLPQRMGSCVIEWKVSKSLRDERLLFMGLFHCFFPVDSYHLQSPTHLHLLYVQESHIKKIC